LYLVLLRIEAAEDVNPSLAAAGQSLTPTGGVAGFSMPVLRYYVGGGTGVAAIEDAKGKFALIRPADRAVFAENDFVDFNWSAIEGAAFYRLEVETEQAAPVLSAIALGGINTYRAPSWLKEKVGGEPLRWRVLAFDQSRNQIGETLRRSLRFESKK
jgi:hypothetical protein